jgi:hypothetical protein
LKKNPGLKCGDISTTRPPTSEVKTVRPCGCTVPCDLSTTGNTLAFKGIPSTRSNGAGISATSGSGLLFTSHHPA